MDVLVQLTDVSKRYDGDTANGELLLDLNATGQTLILVTHNPDLAAVRAPGHRDRRRPGGQRRRYRGAATRAIPASMISS